jgi:tetratricopeptide (TPR) repeat protein
MTKQSRLHALLVAGLLCSLSVPARADSDEDAREAYYTGDNHYAAGRYEEALKYFEKAYALSKRPQLLYNIANAYERMGDYEAAAGYLRKYLKSPDAEDVSSVRQRIRRLEMNAEAKDREVKEAKESRIKQAEIENKPPVDPDPLPEVELRETTEDGARASRKPAYLFLAGSGAAIITATIFGLAAESAAADAEEVCTGGGLCPETAEDALNRERRFALIADVSLVVGLASAGVGVYLLLKDSDDKEKKPTAVRVEPTLYRGGGGIGLSGHF